MDDTKEEPVLIDKPKKKHRRGWFRSFSYWWWGDYESDNDKPNERSVHLKQQCVRQVSLSKVKLKKTETKKRVIPDLEPIKECKKKNQKLKVRFAKEKEKDDSKKLRKNVELSMRQRHQKINYKSRLEILKGL
jgi:hypothetical protein